MSEQEMISLYERAQLLIGVGADSMRGMALLAFQQRKSRQALNVLNEAWGRNSKFMARAVSRHADLFEGEQPKLDSDGYLSLFAMGRLPRKLEQPYYDQWREGSLKAWQVQQLVQNHFEQKKAAHGQRVKIAGAKVWSVGKAEGTEQVELVIHLPSGTLPDPPDWLVLPVTVTLSQETRT